MKRDFLKAFKIGDTELPDEIIDQIMAENGKDIESTKKNYADYESIKEQLKTAKDGLAAFEGVDVAQLQGKVGELTKALNDKDTEWQAKLDEISFQGIVKDAITAAKGKNPKTILPLLDLATLRESKNQAEDIKTALEKVAKENSYLFDSDQTPPPIPGGTGGNPGSGAKNMTLSSALHERYKG